MPEKPTDPITEFSEPIPTSHTDGLSAANPTVVPRKLDAFKTGIVLIIVLILMGIVIGALILYYHNLNINGDATTTETSSSEVSSTISSAITAQSIMNDSPIYYAYGDSMYKVTGNSDPVKVGPAGQMSPDNTQIVYNKAGPGSNGDQDSQFILYDIATQQETIITDTAFNYDGLSNVGWPKFSPNGKYVYDVFSTSLEGTLKVYDVDTHLLAYTDNIWFDKVAWDGDTIIYAVPTDNAEAARPFGSGHSGSIATYDLTKGPKHILISSTDTKDYGLPARTMFTDMGQSHKVFVSETNYILDSNDPQNYSNTNTIIKLVDVTNGDLVTPDTSNPFIQLQDLIERDNPDFFLDSIKQNSAHPGWYLARLITSDKVVTDADLYYVVNLDDISGTLTKVNLNSEGQPIISASW